LVGYCTDSAEACCLSSRVSVSAVTCM
jgi:hypothetical protein